MVIFPDQKFWFCDVFPVVPATPDFSSSPLFEVLLGKFEADVVALLRRHRMRGSFRQSRTPLLPLLTVMEGSITGRLSQSQPKLHQKLHVRDYLPIRKNLKAIPNTPLRVITAIRMVAAGVPCLLWRHLLALFHSNIFPSYDKAYGKLSTPTLTMTVALWKAEYHHFAFLDLWGLRVAILILSWIITLYTLWQMVKMHKIVSGKRFDRYHELG
ncbi:Lysine histidine transporter-like 1 [Platanthera guangdongensis]|uniref:Lysine histidine transporter-like 1 n=1 Tax=Platanthera guangdongensis TaxID=2320717 RepID=A0ABR2N0X9_9ASPA